LTFLQKSNLMYDLDGKFHENPNVCTIWTAYFTKIQKSLRFGRRNVRFGRKIVRFGRQIRMQTNKFAQDFYITY